MYHTQIRVTQNSDLMNAKPRARAFLAFVAAPAAPAAAAVAVPTLRGGARRSSGSPIDGEGEGGVKSSINSRLRRGGPSTSSSSEELDLMLELELEQEGEEEQIDSTILSESAWL